MWNYIYQYYFTSSESFISCLMYYSIQHTLNCLPKVVTWDVRTRLMSKDKIWLCISSVYLTGISPCLCSVPGVLHLVVEEESNTVGNASSFSLLIPLWVKRSNTFLLALWTLSAVDSCFASVVNNRKLRDYCYLWSLNVLIESTDLHPVSSKLSGVKCLEQK